MNTQEYKEVGTGRIMYAKPKPAVNSQRRTEKIVMEAHGIKTKKQLRKLLKKGKREMREIQETKAIEEMRDIEAKSTQEREQRGKNEQ